MDQLPDSSATPTRRLRFGLLVAVATVALGATAPSAQAAGISLDRPVGSTLDTVNETLHPVTSAPAVSASPAGAVHRSVSAVTRRTADSVDQRLGRTVGGATAPAEQATAPVRQAVRQASAPVAAPAPPATPGAARAPRQAEPAGTTLPASEPSLPQRRASHRSGTAGHHSDQASKPGADTSSRASGIPDAQDAGTAGRGREHGSKSPSADVPAQAGQSSDGAGSSVLSTAAGAAASAAPAAPALAAGLWLLFLPLLMSPLPGLRQRGRRQALRVSDACPD